MEVQEQVLPLLEQEALQLEVHQLSQQGLQSQQEVLVLLEQVRAQVPLLEALVRAQVGVLAQVQEEVLGLAVAVGLQRVVELYGQDELVLEKE